MPWMRKSGISFLFWDSLRSDDACAASPRAAAVLGEATHKSRAALLSWDSSGGENISRPGLRCCQPSGFRGDTPICECQTTHHSENACVVSPRGFGGAAGFIVFQLWVQEGAAQAALAKSWRPSDRATCGRQACGTSLRFLSLAARHPWRRVCSLSVNRESCAWSCGALSRLFWGVHIVTVFVLRIGVGMFEVWHCRVCDAGP